VRVLRWSQRDAQSNGNVFWFETMQVNEVVEDKKVSQSPAEPGHGVQHSLRMPLLPQHLCMRRSRYEVVICEPNFSFTYLALLRTRGFPYRRRGARLANVILDRLPQKDEGRIRIIGQSIRDEGVDERRWGSVER